jgi:hypothetical protein
MAQACQDAASPSPMMPSSVSTSTTQREEPGSQPKDHQYGASIGRLIGVARMAVIFMGSGILAVAKKKLWLGWE